MLMVKLGEAGGHLSASWTRSRNDYKRSGSFDIIIFSVTLIADNKGNILGIAFDPIMAVNRDPLVFQFSLKSIGKSLAVVLCQDNTAYKKPVRTVDLDQTEYIQIVSDAKVSADFIFFDIFCIDDDDDLCLIL